MKEKFLVVHCSKEQVEALFPVHAEPVMIDGELNWEVPRWLVLLYNVAV